MCRKVLEWKIIATTLDIILNERNATYRFPIFYKISSACNKYFSQCSAGSFKWQQVPAWNCFFGHFVCSLTVRAPVVLLSTLPVILYSTLSLFLFLALLFSVLLFYSVCNVLFTSVLNAELTKLSSSLSGDSCHCPHAADIHLQLSSTWPETGGGGGRREMKMETKSCLHQYNCIVWLFMQRYAT